MDVSMRPSDVGVTAAAPAHCRTRAAMRRPREGAAAHSADPTAKATRPAAKSRRRPITSPSLPAGTSTAAKTMAYSFKTQEMPATLDPAKLSCIAGTAMLTMNMSSDEDRERHDREYLARARARTERHTGTTAHQHDHGQVRQPRRAGRASAKNRRR